MTVVINSLGKISKRLGLQKDGPAQAFLVESCYKHMDKYVPMRNGDLRNVVELSKNSVTYQSEYASYQYHGQRKDGSAVVKNYTTPGTGPYWDRRMLSAEGDKVATEVQNYIRRK